MNDTVKKFISDRILNEKKSFWSHLYALDISELLALSVKLFLPDRKVW